MNDGRAVSEGKEAQRSWRQEDESGGITTILNNSLHQNSSNTRSASKTAQPILNITCIVHTAKAKMPMLMDLEKFMGKNSSVVSGELEMSLPHPCRRSKYRTLPPESACISCTGVKSIHCHIRYLEFCPIKVSCFQPPIPTSLKG